MYLVTKKQLTEDNNVFFSSLLLSWTHRPQDCTKICRIPFLLSPTSKGTRPKTLSAAGLGWGQDRSADKCPRGHRVPKENITEVFGRVLHNKDCWQRSRLQAQATTSKMYSAKTLAGAPPPLAPAGYRGLRCLGQSLPPRVTSYYLFLFVPSATCTILLVKNFISFGAITKSPFGKTTSAAQIMLLWSLNGSCEVGIPKSHRK